MEPKKSVFKYALGIILGVLVLAGVCSISGCGSGSSGSGAVSSTTTPSPTPDTSGLPPDPGVNGKLTLAGVDADADGVRDDIQRYIALTYPNSAKARAALTQATKLMQSELLDASDKSKSMQHAVEDDRSGECLASLRPDDFVNIERALEAKFLNTEERIRAYLKYNDQLGGEVFSGKPLSEWKTSCAFNPDTLPN